MSVTIMVASLIIALAIVVSKPYTYDYHADLLTDLRNIAYQLSRIADALIVDEETCQKTLCKNCKAYIRNCEDFFDILAGAPSISAEEIDSTVCEPKWIPANSEHPPRSGKYLVTRHEYDYGSRYSSVELMAWDSRIGWLNKEKEKGIVAWWSERVPDPFKVK